MAEDTLGQQRFDMDAIAARVEKAEGNLRVMRDIMVELGKHIETTQLDLNALVLHLRTTERHSAP